MIQIAATHDKKGRVVLLSNTPPPGVQYVFRKAPKITPMNKRLRAMWMEFDHITDNHRYGELDSFQQKTIKRLAKKHFNIELDWKKAQEADGWPVVNPWPASKIFINKLIKRLV